MTEKHYCLQAEKFGGVTEAIGTLKHDMDILFEMNMKMSEKQEKSTKDILEKISDLKGDLKVAKAKFAIMGFLGMIALKFLIDIVKGLV
jgi:hypothetical protein